MARTMKYNNVEMNSASRLGGSLCFSAILIWSFSATLLRFGVVSLGSWQFVGIVCIISGFLHLLFRQVQYGEFRNAFYLPVKLWLITIFGFVLYMLSFPLAIATCKTDNEVCAVTLINYLWPTLTVLLGVILVPNTRFSWKLVLAILLTFTGLILPNFHRIPQLFTEFSTSSDQSLLRRLLPYFLAFTGAVSWAFYSALLSRWRNWAQHYTSCAPGMLITGIIATTVGYFNHSPIERLTTGELIVMLLYALGPSATGYLLWEFAVPRTNIKTLGLMGSLTPVLSIFWLCIFLRYLPGWEVVIAAIMVSLGILLSRKA